MESWDRTQMHRIGAEIMEPKSRHRSPSQSQDRTQKHGTGANITVPIYQHRSLSRSRDRSQNLGTGVNITVPKSRHRSPSQSRDWSRKHTTRHEMLQNKLESDTTTRICNADIMVPKQRCRYYGADISAPESITVMRLDSEAWDWC